jgi:hypothetical protein
MTVDNIGTPSSSTPAETQAAPPNRDEAKRILNETQDAVHEIESGVDRINELMVELLLSGGLSQDAQALANNLGGDANALFADLELGVDALRKEITANDNDDDGGEAD